MIDIKFKTAIMAPSEGENPEILKKQFDQKILMASLVYNVYIVHLFK